MITTRTTRAADFDPIRGDWTTTGAASAMTAESAAALARSVGVRDLTELDRWHGELALAVEELAIDAGCSTIVAVADPLVAVIRALGVIARRHPAATSATAARVVAELAAEVSSRGSPSRA